jgi:hypothetical protein
MTRVERLTRALAEIKNLPDSYFEALLESQNLSTTRTFGGVIIAERTTVINEGDSYNVALDLSRIELMVYNAKRHMLSGQFVNGDHFEITFDAPLPAETTTAIFQRWQSVHENI